MTESFSAEINQLQQQQALFTQALQSMLEGKWAAGPDTVEAFLYALNPNAQGNVSLDLPITQSEAENIPKG